MQVLFVVTAWIAVGAVAVMVMRRRGHDTFAWAVVFLFLGPLALPVAFSADRHRPLDGPARNHDGRLDVLVDHDGSPPAVEALDAALELLGGQMTSLTLAAVLDLEAPTTVRGRQAQHEAEERLQAQARAVAARTGAPVDVVVLHGDPAHALADFAVRNGYELIVVGSDGHGLARASVARRLSTRTPVPLLVGPAN